MHFSLDFWNTIAAPNQEYAYKRTEVIADRIRCNPSTAKDIYTSTKLFLDKRAEKFGIGQNCSVAYDELTMALSDKLIKNPFEASKSLAGLEEELQELFLKYVPHVSKETRIMLEHLTSKGHTFSITSNTNFISGSCIGNFLYDICLERYFRFYIFSDLERVAKPNPVIWEMVKNKCITAAIPSDNIIHIGDHAICDNSSKFFVHRIIKNTCELPILLKEIADAI